MGYKERWYTTCRVQHKYKNIQARIYQVFFIKQQQDKDKDKDIVKEL